MCLLPRGGELVHYRTMVRCHTCPFFQAQESGECPRTEGDWDWQMYDWKAGLPVPDPD